MAVDLTECLVVGISSRALFDLSHEDGLFTSEGLDAYRAFQMENEHRVLEPGTGFPLVKAILRLNETLPGDRRTEVVVMSRNSSETSLRIFNSIDHYGLDITRAALTGGAPLSPYLRAFRVDLLLSQHEDDVQAGINAGIASALLYSRPSCLNEEINQIRIAFDGDAVLFSDESERIFKEHGLEAFVRHEADNARRPLPEGPFARFLKSLAAIQELAGTTVPPIRTALVTARSRPAHERVIRTLRAWNVVVDEVFFLGGMKKMEVLEAFRPHIFFDDQDVHCGPASTVVPVGRVPYVERQTA
ncbi:5'-nucleotidase [Geobacter anodireducens]|nr:5'-nucleotidase [Geobacter anodireducens]